MNQEHIDAYMAIKLNTNVSNEEGLHQADDNADPEDDSKEDFDTFKKWLLEQSDKPSSSTNMPPPPAPTAPQVVTTIIKTQQICGICQNQKCYFDTAPVKIVVKCSKFYFVQC